MMLNLLYFLNSKRDLDFFLICCVQLVGTLRHKVCFDQRIVMAPILILTFSFAFLFPLARDTVGLRILGPH